MMFGVTEEVVLKLEKQGLVSRSNEELTDRDIKKARSRESYYRHRDAILERNRARYAARKAEKEASE